MGLQSQRGRCDQEDQEDRSYDVLKDIAHARTTYLVLYYHTTGPLGTIGRIGV